MSETDTRTHLYWATGCTSCLRAKEFLERNDVDFESHNIAEDMSLLDEMEKQGLPRQVPVVKRGEEWADAQDLEAVARIAAVEYAAEPLPVEELYRRLEIVLDAIERYADQIPVEELDGPIANRPRTVGQLVFHAFSILESFLEHQDGEPLKKYKPEPEWANRSVDALRTYGRHIRARVDDWHEHEAGAVDWSATADVYYGAPSVHEYFERTVWHTGQHARQLAWILDERCGVDPDPSLDPDLWEGLPMPEKVWNDDGGDGRASDDRVNILEATGSD